MAPQTGNLVEFEEKVRTPDEPNSLSNKLKSFVKKWCSPCEPKDYVLGLFPIVTTLRGYSIKTDFPNDVVAGLTSGIMMIPQGMAFAALSTLPPIVGLYISFFSSVSYAILGTGRQVSWGCIAILSLMMADLLDKYDQQFLSLLPNNTLVDSNGQLEGNNGTFPDTGPLSPASRIRVASGVTVVAGLVLIVASRLGLSRITCVMSDWMIQGYTVALSVHLLTSQLKSIFGISVLRLKGPAKVIRTWIDVCAKLPETNLATVVITVCCTSIIYLVKKFVNDKYKQHLRVPVPIELIVLIAATLASYYGDFQSNFGVDVVQDVPTGLPGPELPDFFLIKDVIVEGLVIAIVSYAMTLAVAKTFGQKHGYSVDAHQEMLACGMANLVCGFFSGYITGGSVSRSLVQDGVGGRTQIASLFAAALVLLVIMLIGPYLYYLPTCVLVAIIAVSLRGMFLKLLTIPKLWRKSKLDCAVWVVSFFATLVLNADVGLLVSIGFSLLLVFLRTILKPVTLVGQVGSETSTVQLRSLVHYPSAVSGEKTKIIKVKTPLYFINADSFVTNVLSLLKVYPVDMKSKLQNACEGTQEINSSEKNSRPSSWSSKQEILSEVNMKTEIYCIDNPVVKDHTSNMTPGKQENGSAIGPAGLSVTSVILEMSEVSFIDVMGVQALEHVLNELSSVGVEVSLVQVPENIFPMLKSTGFWTRCAHRMYLDLRAALLAMDLEACPTQPVSQYTRL